MNRTFLYLLIRFGIMLVILSALDIHTGIEALDSLLEALPSDWLRKIIE